MKSPSSSPKQLPNPDLNLLDEVGGKGRGVFAGRPFTLGEEVLEFLGEVRDVESFQDLTYALQIGPRQFLTASGGVDDFVNHSCEPNCGIRSVDGRVVLFALQPIAQNDEITFDYSTTQTGGYWSMDCQCGAPHCRGVIGDFKDLPEKVKAFYVESKAVLPYLIDEVLLSSPSKVRRAPYKSGRRSRKQPIPARNC